jgi:hypothetical protein
MGSSTCGSAAGAHPKDAALAVLPAPQPAIGVCSCMKCKTAEGEMTGNAVHNCSKVLLHAGSQQHKSSAQQKRAVLGWL